MAERDFTCPLCNAELTIDEQYIGVEISCPGCGGTFVPQAPAPAKTKLKLNMAALGQVGQSTAGEDTGEFVSIEDDADEFVSIEEEEEIVSIDDAETADSGKINLGSAFNFDMQDDDKVLPEPDPGSTHVSYSMSIVFRIIWLILGVFAFIGLFAGDDGAEIAAGIWLVILAVIWGVYAAVCKARSGNQRIRSLIKEYFGADGVVSKGAQLLDFICNDIVGNIPVVNAIPEILNGIAKKKRDAFCLFREPFYDRAKRMDMKYLEELNVLRRFGKDTKDLVAPMQTLFAPAFAGVADLRNFACIVGEKDGIYRYNLEEVTKVYTFEDQLFIYTGIWAYDVGKMIEERTEAFFFKDITDIRTESTFKIHEVHIQAGCLSIFIPWLGKTFEKVYKESESFVLTSSSGNSIGLTIGFEEAIAVTGAVYTSRNDNERIIHAIRKMIEEKKVANNG